METAPASRPILSLVGGGPIDRLLTKLGLIKAGTASPGLRVALAIGVTWVPLLVLSAAQGVAIGDEVRIAFLHDFAAYARYLVGVPLLILAEGLIHTQIPRTADQFVRWRFVPERNLPDYESAVRRVNKGRDSALAEGLLLGLTVTTVFLSRHQFHFDFSTWRSLVTASVHTRTLAGWWNLCVAMPLFQYLVWRWLWRLLLWYRFLWDMSRLDLQVVPTHPDRSGGLGFVGDGQRFFWLIVFAASSTTSGVLADEIIYKGVPLASFKFTIAGYVVAALLFFLGPLLIFAPRLSKARIESLHDYGNLAVSHHRLFDRKWVQGDNPKGDSLLGTPDISSMGDLDCAHDVLEEMKPVPFDPGDAVALALAALLPMAPLLLTVIPLDEMFKMLFMTLG